MNLYPVSAGNFKLDGGAMFGVVPKNLWQRTNPADKDNLIDIAARCLLIENGNKLILIDAGMGDKQSDKFFSYYKPWGGDNLLGSIKKVGFGAEDVTDVFLTHLHFDHCGGCTKRNGDGFDLVFPNAKIWSNRAHWDWAVNPNAREKASFLTENLLPIEQSGHLEFITHGEGVVSTPLGFDVLFVDGHTEKQMIPMIPYKGETLVFMADLLPTAGHIPVPYVMGYDTRPLLTMKEKLVFLQEAADKDFLLFLEHDVHNPLVRVQHTEKGVRLKSKHSLEEYF